MGDSFVFPQRNVFARKNTNLYLAMNPPTQRSEVTTGGGGDADIKILNEAEVETMLDLWSTIVQWDDASLRKMKLKVLNTTPDDIFFGYMPMYKGTRKTLYVFYATIDVINDQATLSVCSGVRCPYENTNISSKGFKELLPKLLPILKVNYDEILRDDKFRLSWSMDYPASHPSV